MTASDLDLLRQYAREGMEDAFTALVNRHLDLVYSAALRQVGSAALAEEVAQSVFTDLARNAFRLRPDTLLTAWLYQVTRRTAINLVRKESSRQMREQIALELADMKTNGAEWTQVGPLLDEAMEALPEADRSAILLRYFENRSLREVGQTLGMSEDAAQKRVSRAVERLREFFSKQGLTVGAGGLAALLSANAVQSSPVGLGATISAAAALSGAGIQNATTLGAAKIIAMTTKEMQDRVGKLKQCLVERPEARIPEFRFLKDGDYWDAIRPRPLNCEEDYLATLSSLRSSAEFSFIVGFLNPALTQYAKTNDGQFPTSLSQCQPAHCKSRPISNSRPRTNKPHTKR